MGHGAETGIRAVHYWTEAFVIVVTVTRKPIEGTVARNVLKWGCGGINIDASRIGLMTDTEVKRSGMSTGMPLHEGGHKPISWRESAFPQGRWPANLILSHLPTCQNHGTVDIPAGPPTPSGMDRINMNMAMHGARPNTYQKDTPVAPADRRNPDGTETVPVWVCVEGCPVAALDGQSGERPGMSGGGATADNANKKTGAEVIPSFNRKPSAPFIRSDTGGASRFFKQIQG